MGKRSRASEDRKLAKAERRAERRARKGGKRDMYYDDEYRNMFFGDYDTGYVSNVPRKVTKPALNPGAGTAASSVDMAAAAELAKMLLASQAKTYASYEEAMADENPLPDSYFPTASGWMVLQRRCIDGNTMQFINKVTRNPLLNEVAPQSSISIVNKIPKDLLVEIVGSFARICKKNGNEAAAQIYRERDGEMKYFIYYPEQKISGASVTYADDPTMLEMRSKHNLIMELHSHNTMSAFWSGTDNSNEKDCGLYMVIGTFGAASATYKCRYKYGNTYADFPAHEIFDMTAEEEAELLKRENWSEGNPIIEEKAKAHAVTYTGGYYNSGSYYNGYGNYNGRYAGNYAAANEFRNSGKLPKTLLVKYEQFRYSVISRDNHPDLNSALWTGSKQDVNGKYTCENHRWQYDPETSRSAWVPITMDAEAAKAEENVPKIAQSSADYVAKLEATWNESELLKPNPAFTSRSTATGGTGYAYNYSYNSSPAAALDHLLGSNDDDAARLVAMPGTVDQYKGYGVPAYSPGINDEFFIASVEQQAIARATANECVENSYNKCIYEDYAYLPATESEFRKRVVSRINSTGIETTFDPTIMWELFTGTEKSRLARTIGCTVVELSKMFGELYEERLCYPFVLFIYWAVLIKDDYRGKLTEYLDAIYDKRGINVFDNNLIMELNDIFREEPNIVIDITRPKDAEPFAALTDNEDADDTDVADATDVEVEAEVADATDVKETEEVVNE